MSLDTVTIPKECVTVVVVVLPSCSKDGERAVL